MSYFVQQSPAITATVLPLALVNLGKQRGIHPDKLLKGTQLFYQDLTQPHKLISQQQWVRLVTNSQKLINQDDLSFMLGRQLLPQLPANLRHAIEHGRNLAQVLGLVAKQQVTLCPHFFVTVKNHQNKHYWLLNEAISVEHLQYQIFMFELYASALVSIIKTQLGQMAPNLSIRLPYQQPKYIEQYHTYLSCDCQFIVNPGFNAMQISFDKELLFCQFAQADQKLMTHYLSQHPVDHKTNGVGLLQYVNHLIEQQIKTEGQATLENIANQMQISVATLKRKLSQHNTSFQRLFDQQRQQQAIFQLTEQRLSNEQVANELNFNDLTNFRRAIKRWTGLTPSALKRLLPIS